jgi:hypothetical protein
MLYMTVAKSNSWATVKIHSQLLVLIAFSLVAGCTSHSPVWSKGTDEEIRAVAAKTARADIAAGQPRLCLAGGRGAGPVGIPQESWYLVKDLPEWNISKGCSDPFLVRSVIFGEAYNREILTNLVQRKSQ